MTDIAEIIRRPGMVAEKATAALNLAVVGVISAAHGAVDRLSYLGLSAVSPEGRRCARQVQGADR